MKAQPNWAIGAEVDLGVIEAEDEDEAIDEAHAKASARLDAWVELIPEPEAKES